ncbi:MAG: hypothetical protein FWF78_11025 [Defluviitaleaceae bacterium]|nr:hypothetical protein [Defluviitaleaceae bacterium]
MFKAFSFVIIMFLASCAYDPALIMSGLEHGELEELGERDIITPEEARERLLEMGWELEWFDTMDESESMLVNMYNQSRFIGYTDNIYHGIPIGESGETIAPQYFGGLKFDELGFLVVSVLPMGFDDPSTAIAIKEMLDMGIIIRQVQFNHQSISSAIGRLNSISDKAFAMGAASWGQGAENAVTVWLDPYTDEQKAIFNDFLVSNGLDPAIFLIQPAITQEMLDRRAESITIAATSAGNIIIPVSELEVSRTGIVFSLKNTTDMPFNYGSPWDLAQYEDGAWLPVPHLPGAGVLFWTSIGFSLQGGGIQQYYQSFEWHFGELPIGRYMFIRDGWLGEWSRDRESVYALVEFEITATTPTQLDSLPDDEWPVYIEVIEISDVTPTGMRVTIENISSYDIDHRAQILFIVPAEHTTVGEPWQWWNYQLPFLDFDDTMQGFGQLPAGERLEFELELGNIFGELPPGDYRLSLSLGGQASPPHPTGWAFNNDTIIEFSVM